MPEQKEIDPNQIIPEEYNFSEKVYNFFQQIAFLRRSDEEKEEMSLQIVQDSTGDRLYWTEIFLSAIIVTFGLLQNSVAVIIGAMVIAPLLRPIKGLAFAIASGQAARFWKSFKLLLLSMVVVIGLSYLFSVMIPLKIETNEIAARTAPNLLDLFIAIASGIIALLAMSFTRLSEGVAGVAMAAALLPPLSVVGIELALGNYESSLGSLLLFVTNILAIIFVGTIIFILFGFAPHQKESQKRTFENLLILLGLTVLISIPLFSSLLQIADRISVQQKANEFLSTTIEDFYAQANVSEINVINLDQDKVHLLGVINLPEGVQFFEETQSTIRDQLGDELGRDVQFDVEIIRTARIQSREDSQKNDQPPFKETLKAKMREVIAAKQTESTVLNIEVSEIVVPEVEKISTVETMPTTKKTEREEEPKWTVKSVISLPTGVALSDESKKIMETEMRQHFEGKKLSFFWVNLSQAAPPILEEGPSPREEFYEEVNLKWAAFINETLPSDASFENLEVTWELTDDFTLEAEKDFSPDQIGRFLVKFDLFLSQGAAEWIPDLRAATQNFAIEAFDRPADIEIRTFDYSIEKISSDMSLKTAEGAADVKADNVEAQ